MLPADDATLAAIASDDVLEQAYTWLCARRNDVHPNDSVWDVRWRWVELKPAIQADLLAGRYRFAPVRRLRGEEGTHDVWDARDALVLKAVTIVLTELLRPRLSAHCYHLAGRGGAKAAVRAALAEVGEHGFVFRTDVKSYYASLDHDILLGLVRQHVSDPRVLDLVAGAVRRTVDEDGVCSTPTRGIALGCALSPLLGALYLTPLDERMETSGLLGHLGKVALEAAGAVQQVNELLALLKVEKHPDKTFIGRVARGFDFLGISFPRPAWASPRRRWNALWTVQLGFMSKVRTPSASRRTCSTGCGGCGRAACRWRPTGSPRSDAWRVARDGGSECRWGGAHRLSNRRVPSGTTGSPSAWD